MDFEYIRGKSKEAFKQIVRTKSKELALQKLLDKKESHSKLNNLSYSEICMQSYLLREDLNIRQKRLLFKMRTRMADYGKNFRGGKEKIICQLCNDHIDSQEMSYYCPEIVNNITVRGSAEEIYDNDVSVNTVVFMEKVEDYRKMRKDEKNS